ncbi:hypothetical protein GF319_07020 [Candidatus Bathyarchaeota archaeon]|nr:hypothetical protein [Candidatus Bathyarchaeota archaeon]
MQSLRLAVPQEGNKPIELEISDQGTIEIRANKNALRSGFIHEAIVNAFEQIRQEEEYSIYEIYKILRERRFNLFSRIITIRIFVDDSLVSLYNIDMTGDINSIISEEWINSDILRINTMALRVFLTERYISLQNLIKGLGKIAIATKSIRILTGIFSGLFILIGTLRNAPAQFLNALIPLSIFVLSNYFYLKNSLEVFTKHVTP